MKLRTMRPASAHGLGAWVKRTLQEAELEPPEMPPSSVLLVRRLEGRLHAHAGASRAEAVRWESDVKGRIGRSFAQASRPVRGDLPSEAEAVLFRDPAEMTASLIWDVARGTAADRWWWQSAIGDPAA